MGKAPPDRGTTVRMWDVPLMSCCDFKHPTTSELCVQGDFSH
jgi:hypothetical protein